MKALTTLFVVGMFLTTVAVADDVDDVKAAVQSYFAAVNAGDADGRVLITHWHKNPQRFIPINYRKPRVGLLGLGWHKSPLTSVMLVRAPSIGRRLLLLPFLLL